MICLSVCPFVSRFCLSVCAAKIQNQRRTHTFLQTELETDPDSPIKLVGFIFCLPPSFWLSVIFGRLSWLFSVCQSVRPHFLFFYRIGENSYLSRSLSRLLAWPPACIAPSQSARRILLSIHPGSYKQTGYYYSLVFVTSSYKKTELRTDGRTDRRRTTDRLDNHLDTECRREEKRGSIHKSLARCSQPSSQSIESFSIS